MKSVSYLCITLLLLPALPAQTVISGGWTNVQSITPGRKVQVYRFGTDRVDGEFRSASADGLVLASKAGERNIARREIREVKLRKASGRAKNAGIGAAVGAGVGAGIGLAVIRGDFEDLGAAIFVIFTMIGSAAGFGLGFLAPGYGTVYKAQQP
jgi:hypothetical protein